MGTYVEKPSLKVDWEQYADHATNDSMVKRGINQEMVDSYVANGKALSQGNGKYAFVSRDGVAVVTSNGKLVTTWSSANFDANMLEIVDKLFGKGKQSIYKITSLNIFFKVAGISKGMNNTKKNA
ncbi:MAG: hypothetical protein ACLSBH_16600 [Coprobacillus cateniformis]